MMRPEENAQAVAINPGYAVWQLARALKTSTEHVDPEVRARGTARVDRWNQVLAKLLDGTLTVGSRTPLGGTPAWATLEVVKGGFATGKLMAGGALQPHELALLQRLGRTPESGRGAINAYYITDEGLAELTAMLRTGCYRVHVPEQGALLALAWLLDHGAIERAQDLLDAIVGFFDQLQFYPVPEARPMTPSAVVRLQTVGETAKTLKMVEVPTQVARMNEALRVWTPLGDRAVALFMETVEGAPPKLLVDAAGEHRRSRSGAYLIEGGWPCRHYPEGWSRRALALLEEYAHERASHVLCRKPERPRENFARLRGYLERCARDPKSLTGRDVGMVRKILAAVNTRRGLPGSEDLVRLREVQAAHASRPTAKELSAVLVNRLRGKAADEGLSTIEDVVGPVREDEAEARAMASGTTMPEHLVRSLLRCLEAPIDELVAKRVITSSEVIARMLPQVTAQIVSAGVVDPGLRSLYSAVYAAFRRRRSLLLLNLEHQVRFEELPWHAAIRPFSQGSLDEAERARQALEQLAILAIGSFPFVILPNKLLQEVRALAKTARLDLTVVDEIAADIFMGTFSDKYLAAAQGAALIVEGTLYERYYGLSYASVLGIDVAAKRALPGEKGKASWITRLLGRDKEQAPSRASASSTFAALCAELAGPASDKASFVAKNGTVIEQEQILTTHNLAPLFAEFRLTERLAVVQLARECFSWICRQHQSGIKDWRARLQMMKNTAYAWRQMLFFVSLAPSDDLDGFVAWTREHLAKQGPAFRERFAPAVCGLEHVAAGGRFDNQGLARTPRGEGRRFLGWTTERHWLMPNESKDAK
jgi:hypothetical protein